MENPMERRRYYDLLRTEHLFVEVKLFKPSGKYAYSGIVNVGTARLWSSEDLANAIVANQEFVGDTFKWWEEDYFTVVTSTDKYCNEFVEVLYTPERFAEKLKGD